MTGTVINAVAALLVADSWDEIFKIASSVEPPEFILTAGDFIDGELPPVYHDDRSKCVNSNRYSVCKNKADLGHIYCTSCRLATGGYMRYNRRTRPTA